MGLLKPSSLEVSADTPQSVSAGCWRSYTRLDFAASGVFPFWCVLVCSEQVGIQSLEASAGRGFGVCVCRHVGSPQSRAGSSARGWPGARFRLFSTFLPQEPVCSHLNHFSCGCSSNDLVGIFIPLCLSVFSLFRV